MDVLTIAGLAVALAAATAGVMVIRPARRSSRPAAVELELDRFKTRHRRLRTTQVELGEEALHSTPESWRSASIPVLTKPGWIFSLPQHFDSVRIHLHPDSPMRISPAELRLLKGLALSGPLTYSEAVQLVNPLSPYFNGVIYRPLSVVAKSESLSISFERGNYFDYLDSSEILAYEASLAPKTLGARARIEDPFDFNNRTASLGILTLTIVKSRDGTSSFLMHRRSGKFVVGDALYHVVPAGEFTPSDIGKASEARDFDLWRNIMREYAEELLGLPDAQGQGGRKIDYAGASPYREINAAIADGSIQPYVFGLGLDPLTYKPELLTAAVFEKSTYEKIFPGPLPETEEGIVIEDIPFSESGIRDYLQSRNCRPGAKACLQLAWSHRDMLGLY